jgi:hypothetical protein
MKISQPFDDMPLWQFENIDIPELNYSKYRYISGQNMDFLTSDPIYSKRKRIEFTELNQCEDFKQIKIQVIDLIEKIKKTNTLRLDILYPMDAWDMYEYPIDILIDNSSFDMGNHIDNRNVKCNLFLNLQHNMSSTEFSIVNQHTPFNTTEFKPSIREWKGPTEKGTGYFWFNCPELWHRIHVTDVERKIAMMGVTIK